jgi:hypothetical protein
MAVSSTGDDLISLRKEISHDVAADNLSYCYYSAAFGICPTETIGFWSEFLALS